MLPCLVFFSSSNVQTAYTCTSHWSMHARVFFNCGFACVIWVAQITCTYSYIYGTRKVFLHCGFAYVIWDTEPVCRKCYIGYKNKAFCHCALPCVFGGSKLEWKNICIGHMKRASSYGALAYVFIYVFIFEACLEEYSHWLHAKGLSSLWIILCVLKACAVVEE